MIGLNDVLMFSIPALITGGMAYVVINKFLTQESKKQVMELRKENVKHSTPLRLQAYERLILLLERIEPISVINRVIKPGMTAREIQLEIIRNISEEYNHNITQQLYVSGSTWEEIRKAKDDSIKLVSLTATKIPNDRGAMEFSELLIKLQAENELFTCKTALQTVKKEVRSLF